MNINVQILLDANLMVVGSYAGMHSDKGQTQDFVYLEYYPFNGFLGKVCRYPHPVRREHVKFFPPIQNGMKGIPTQFVLVLDPQSDKGIAPALRSEDSKRVTSLLAEKKELLNQIAVKDQALLSAKQGAVGELTHSRKVVNKNKDSGDDDNNPLSSLNRMRNFGNM
jgi:hypothetical protein